MFVSSLPWHYLGIQFLSEGTMTGQELIITRTIIHQSNNLNYLQKEKYVCNGYRYSVCPMTISLVSTDIAGCQETHSLNRLL